MNWIFASLIMYCASVMLYLAIRKAQLKDIPIAIYSLWMFGLPFFGYFLIIFLSEGSFVVTCLQLFKLVGAAIFFSWLGNVFSQKSILHAPNPGYALIISKSYVVFTTLVAILLFGAEFTLRRAVAILLIVLFSALIILSDGRKEGEKKIRNIMWFWHSLGAFFCWAFLALTSKHLLNQGLDASVLLFYICLIVTTLVAVETKAKKIDFRVAFRNIPILFVIGASSMIFNLFMQIGFKNAPNIGYINAVNTSSIALVTIFSSVLFKDSLSNKKMIGVLGVTAGLTLLFI